MEELAGDGESGGLAATPLRSPGFPQMRSARAESRVREDP